jgi:hypothetical protein
MRKYAGADWLESNKKPMSDFGRTVADLVGDVALGIYHWPDSVMAADWTDSRAVTLKGHWAEFATHDGNELTRLVVLAHDRHIRVAVRGHGMNGMAITFHKREREGDFAQRHPTLEDAARNMRNVFGYPEELQKAHQQMLASGDAQSY